MYHFQGKKWSLKRPSHSSSLPPADPPSHEQELKDDQWVTITKYYIWVARYQRVALSLDHAQVFFICRSTWQVISSPSIRNYYLYYISTRLSDLRLKWKYHVYTACSQLKYHISTMCDTQIGCQHFSCHQFKESSKYLLSVALGDLSNKGNCKPTEV